MKLYEIKEEILNCINNIEVDEETGEILNADKLDELQEEFDEKAEGIALYIKNLTAEGEAIKTEEKRLAERRKAVETRVERLKDYLSDAMQATDTLKLTTARVALSFRKSKSVDVGDRFVEWARTNAHELLTFKDPTPNKTAIKDYINKGIAVEYASIVENSNLVIK